jgi:Tol biopolymer transport system component
VGGLENLGPNINTPDGWESQPTLSADGNTLYFATIRPNTDGIDIFQSKRTGKGAMVTRATGQRHQHGWG